MLPVANSIQMLCSPAYTCCGAKARMILNYFLPIRYSASRVARAQRAAKQQPYALLLSTPMINRPVLKDKHCIQLWVI